MATTELLEEDVALVILLKNRMRRLRKKAQQLTDTLRSTRERLEDLDTQLTATQLEMQWIDNGVRALERTPFLNQVDYETDD